MGLLEEGERIRIILAVAPDRQASWGRPGYEAVPRPDIACSESDGGDVRS